LTGEDPPPPPPKPRFYTMAINPRAQGSGGYNTGRYGGVGVSGGVTLDEALTLLDDPDQNLWIHSASVDVGAGGTLHLPPLLFGEQRQGRRPPRFPGPWPSPSINGGAAIDVGLRYRYISREGEPVRLVLVYEQTFSRLGGAGAGFRDNPGGDRYRGGGGSVAARTTETVVREAHLDLTIPENREAFQRLFVTLGPTAHPDPAMIARFLTSGADLAEPASDIAALIQRFDEDGAFAQFQYEGSGFEGSLGFANYPGQAGGGRRGMWGVFPSTGESERHLIDAQFMDNRQDNPEYAPLRSCTEPSSGNGITPNTGSNPRPPSGGGPGGQP
jgi:hypothetical protein